MYSLIQINTVQWLEEQRRKVTLSDFKGLTQHCNFLISAFSVGT